MKKILLTFGLIILTGCSLGSGEKSVKKIITNEYIQSQISILQNRIDLGELTEAEAQEELKKNLKENKKLNDGSTKSILKKFEIVNPEAAKMLEEKIRKNHPEEFED